MKNIIKKENVIFFILVWLMACLISVSLLYSNQEYSTFHFDDRYLTGVLTLEDLDYTHNCEVDADGNVETTDEDAFLVFNCPYGMNYAVVNLQPAGDIDVFPAQLYYSSSDSFGEPWSMFSTYSSVYGCILFEKTLENVTKIRLDIDEDYHFETIKLYSQYSYVTKEKVDSKLQILWGVLIGTVISIVVLALFIKFNWVGKIKDFGVKLCSSPKVRCFLFVSLIILCISKYLIRFVLGVYIFKFYFFVFAFLEVIAFAVIFREYTSNKPEYLISFIVFAVGITVMLTAPFAHNSWDIESHYSSALNASYIGRETQITFADNEIRTNVPYFETVSYSRANEYEKIDRINLEYNNVIITETEESPLSAYWLSGAAIAVARFLGLSFHRVFYAGILSNLLIYTALVYFAVRKLKSGKILFGVIALMPVNIYIASNYTYDYWVIGFTMLGMAYFISACQSENTISMQDTIIMSGLMAIGCLPKQVYLLMLIFPFLLPWKKIADKRKYYGTNLLILSLLLLSFLFVSARHVSGEGDLRGGSAVNPAEQVSFIFNNLSEYMQIEFSFIGQYLSKDNMQTLPCNYDKLGFLGSGFTIVAVLLIITAITDRGKEDIKAYGIVSRIYALFFFVSEIGLISTALYISFTAVGSSQIAGVQTRYVIPLIYPVLSLIAGEGIGLGNTKRYAYNLAVIGIMFLLNFYCIYEMIIKIWI